MLFAGLLAAVALGQTAPTCTAPAYSTCDLVFDLNPGETPGNASIQVEIRSPKQRTYVIVGFREGNSFVARVAPTEAGDWVYRIKSGLKRFDGVTGRITGLPSLSPGFVHPANAHHFATENNKQHLWMGTALENFVKIPRAEFDRLIQQRAEEKFTHLRVTIDADSDLRDAADRIRAINAQGIVGDLVLAGIPDDRAARERYVTEMVARFGAMNITWAGGPKFEGRVGGKALLRDSGVLIAKLDSYGHPRGAMADDSSAALSGDQWMTLLSYGNPDPNIGAVEHQLYALPALNTGIKSQRDLWTATMNGQYPSSGSGRYMTAWYDFMSGNRYWELEPYFDVEGGRALSLDGVEYIVYVEKPGPVELTVEDHGYDVAWINPATGERTKVKGFRGKRFTGAPPDSSHDWVLHVSREGTKESMLKSYKFDSRPVPVQEVETAPAKIPYEVKSPADGGELSISKPATFLLESTRNTKASREALVEWTGEVVIDGEGSRVIGTGREGTFRIPPGIAKKSPAVLSIRISILNGSGKAYVLDKAYKLIP